MSSTIQRWIAACGLGYPVLTIIGFAAFPEPPGGDVSAAHDPAWLAGHTGAVIAQSYVRGAAAVAFILLTVAVYHSVTTAARDSPLAALALAGGSACGVLLLSAQTTTLAAAFASRAHLPDSAQTFDSLNQALLSLSSLPALLLFAAAAIAWRAVETLPLWFTILTAIGVPMALLDALAYQGGPLSGLGLLGLAYFLVWSLAAAICLARSDGSRTYEKADA